MEGAKARDEMEVFEECPRSWDTGWSVAGSLMFTEQKCRLELPLRGLMKAGNTNEARFMSCLQCVFTCLPTHLMTRRTRTGREENEPERSSGIYKHYLKLAISKEDSSSRSMFHRKK